VDASPPAGPSLLQRSRLWQAGTLVGGRFRLVAKIGAGSMGEVWRAEHLALGTSVAVKLVDTSGRDDAGEMLARFQQEARAAAHLRSPHVVQMLDHGADGPIAFIAMELLEGESLEHRLTRRGRLFPSEVAHVMREMARGVSRAHAAGIIHRDLKPPNVFLCTHDGVEIVKVLDFGIAKMLGTQRDAHLQTQQGYVVGTPAYMSPEQVLGKALDARSDLWQMGVMAFECLLGKRPFEGETLGSLFLGICSGPLPLPSVLGKVPAGFDAWFFRACERDPEKRFRGATEMAEALFAILAPGGVGESAIATMASDKREVPEISAVRGAAGGGAGEMSGAGEVSGASTTGAGGVSGAGGASGGGVGVATGRSVAWSGPGTGAKTGARAGAKAAGVVLLALVPVMAAAVGTGIWWGMRHEREGAASGSASGNATATGTGTANANATATATSVDRDLSGPRPGSTANATATPTAKASATASANAVGAASATGVGPGVKKGGGAAARGGHEPDFGF
jgi:eukaryotic-like serine/threonine-protein kinase